MKYLLTLAILLATLGVASAAGPNTVQSTKGGTPVITNPNKGGVSPHGSAVVPLQTPPTRQSHVQHRTSRGRR